MSAGGLASPDRRALPLLEADVAADPIVQFARWYDEAHAVHGDDADAMVLATAGSDSAPSARVVLLRGVDRDGFRFYSNVESRKGRDLDDNPRAALVLHWPGLGRQVRVSGTVQRLPDTEANAYWRNRPPASQLSAWASHQSEPIRDRDALERAVADVVARFDRNAEAELPLPPFWGGYLVVPSEIEFWQHRDDRLHDRLRYTRQPAGAWLLDRLQP